MDVCAVVGAPLSTTVWLLVSLREPQQQLLHYMYAVRKPIRLFAVENEYRTTQQVQTSSHRGHVGELSSHALRDLPRCCNATARADMDASMKSSV